MGVQSCVFLEQPDFLASWPGIARTLTELRFSNAKVKCYLNEILTLKRALFGGVAWYTGGCTVFFSWQKIRLLHIFKGGIDGALFINFQ